MKPGYGLGIDAVTYNATLAFFDKLLRMIHPFMPFITEELWQAIAVRKEGETVMLQPYPAPAFYSRAYIDDFRTAQETVANIRNIRQSKNLSPKDALSIFVENFPMEMISVVKRLANVEILDSQAGSSAVSFMVGTSKVSVELSGKINVDEEIRKLEADLAYQHKFLAQVRGKLGNEKFVAHAPEAVIAVERKKESDALERIASIEASLKALKQ